VSWRERGRPVSADAASWILGSLGWLREQFGDGALHREVMRLEWAADTLHGVQVEDRANALAPAIAKRMDLDMSDVTISVVPDVESLGMVGKAPGLLAYSGAAGTYEAHTGGPRVGISESQLARPVSLIATLAHEFAHVRLLGEGRMQRDRGDMEQMTDLATVFFGFGIFSANASFDFSQSAVGWRRSELGYLGEAMLGFALAAYATIRGERHPTWVADLDGNPRAYLQRSIKFLARNPMTGSAG
jgi:hypothetical protein